MIALNTASTPSPLLALICRCPSSGRPRVEAICSEVSAGDACGRSTLLMTGMSVRSASSATWKTESVCAWIPSARELSFYVGTNRFQGLTCAVYQDESALTGP